MAIIEVWRGARVIAIDAEKKTLDDEGGVLEFTKLLVCTGWGSRGRAWKGSPTSGPSLTQTSSTGSLPGER